MDKVIFRTNAIKGGSKLLPLIIAMNGILAPMFIAIYLGVNVWFTMLIMLAGAFLAVSFVVSKGEYVIDDEGITEVLNPFWPKVSDTGNKKKFFPWSAVKAYKLWSDMPKGAITFDKTEEKVVLEIYFKNTNYKIVFNNGKTPESRAEFTLFTEAFLSKVENINTAPLIADPKPSDLIVTEPVEYHPVIERKRSFYEKPIAKVYTIALIGITGVLLYFVLQGYGTGSSVYRMFFVLIPGTAYMFWRTFTQSGRG